MKTSDNKEAKAAAERIAEHLTEQVLSIFGDNFKGAYYVLLGTTLSFALRAGIKKEDVSFHVEQSLTRVEAQLSGGVN